MQSSHVFVVSPEHSIRLEEGENWLYFDGHELKTSQDHVFGAICVDVDGSWLSLKDSRPPPVARLLMNHEKLPYRFLKHIQHNDTVEWPNVASFTYHFQEQVVICHKNQESMEDTLTQSQDYVEYNTAKVVNLNTQPEEKEETGSLYAETQPLTNNKSPHLLQSPDMLTSPLKTGSFDYEEETPRSEASTNQKLRSIETSMLSTKRSLEVDSDAETEVSEDEAKSIAMHVSKESELGTKAKGSEKLELKGLSDSEVNRSQEEKDMRPTDLPADNVGATNDDSGTNMDANTESCHALEAKKDDPLVEEEVVVDDVVENTDDSKRECEAPRSLQTIEETETNDAPDATMEAVHEPTEESPVVQNPLSDQVESRKDNESNEEGEDEVDEKAKSDRTNTSPSNQIYKERECESKESEERNDPSQRTPKPRRPHSPETPLDTTFNTPRQSARRPSRTSASVKRGTKSVIEETPRRSTRTSAAEETVRRSTRKRPAASKDQVVSAKKRARRQSREGKENEVYRIASSGVTISAEHRTMIVQLGGKFVDTLQEIESVTHLIAGDDKTSIRRTPKVLIAMNSEAHIVHLDWLIESGKAGKFIEPNKTHLLLNDSKAEEEFSFSMKETLARRLLRREGEEVRLLDGWTVYVCMNLFSDATVKVPDKKTFRLIVESTGAKWTDRLSDTGFANTLIITKSEQYKPPRQMRGAIDGGAKLRTFDWLFGSIMRQEHDLK